MRKGGPYRERVVLYACAADLPEAWSEALPEDHPLQKKYLQLQDQIVFEDVARLYAAVYKNDKPLLLTSFQVLSFRDHHVDTSKLRRWQKRLWNIFRRIHRPRLLVSGHLFRHDFPAVFIPPAVPAFDAFKAYRQALKAAARKTRADAVLLKDMPGDFEVRLQHFAPQYRLIPGDVSMELLLRAEWASLGDYEKALKHKYAQRMRNIRKAGAGLKVCALDAGAVERYAPEIHRLYRQVAENQPVRLGFLGTDYLPFLKRHFPDTFQVWGFFEAEKLLAFASAWQRPGMLDMFYIGFDYSHNRERQLYFNMLLSAIERGIAAGVPKIIFGRTALEAKARLGAQAVYLQSFLYIRNPIARAVVDQLQTALAETEGDWERRHPFR